MYMYGCCHSKHQQTSYSNEFDSSCRIVTIVCLLHVGRIGAASCYFEPSWLKAKLASKLTMQQPVMHSIATNFFRSQWSQEVSTSMLCMWFVIRLYLQRVNNVQSEYKIGAWALCQIPSAFQMTCWRRRSEVVDIECQNKYIWFSLTFFFYVQSIVMAGEVNTVA